MDFVNDKRNDGCKTGNDGDSDNVPLSVQNFAGQTPESSNVQGKLHNSLRILVGWFSLTSFGLHYQGRARTYCVHCSRQYTSSIYCVYTAPGNIYPVYTAYIYWLNTYPIYHEFIIYSRKLSFLHFPANLSLAHYNSRPIFGRPPITCPQILTAVLKTRKRKQERTKLL